MRFDKNGINPAGSTIIQFHLVLRTKISIFNEKAAGAHTTYGKIGAACLAPLLGKLEFLKNSERYD